MTEPKFSVGEVVILQSKSSPEFNGEYYIACVVFKGQSLICRITGFKYISNCFGYLLNKSFDAEDSCLEALWCESALRKKHQPGEMTFEGLIMSLNNPVNVEGVGYE